MEDYTIYEPILAEIKADPIASELNYGLMADICCLVESNRPCRRLITLLIYEISGAAAYAKLVGNDCDSHRLRGYCNRLIETGMNLPLRV